MNKQQLASKIWQSANKMRSKIEANEYKDYILGFIFYKYLSDKEIAFLKDNDWTDEDIADSLNEDNSEAVTYVQQSIGYFISYNDLFSTWLKMGSGFDVSNVRDALSAFSRLIDPSHKKVFEGIFDTLQTGLSKLGDSSGSQTKAISGLLQLIKDIPMDGKQDYDVLGFIYEYLISMFAANAGKKAGEFYTPHEVSLLMSEIVAHHLKNQNQIKIYDPTSGSGSLLINIGKSVAKHVADKNCIQYYAQELVQNTYNLTRMNLIMRGILPANLVTRNGDTLESDWPYFDDNDPAGTYEPLYVDAVVSNPPYSQNWDPSNKENNPRFAGYGLAPKSKADYAFLLHDLYHIKPDGIVTIVLPHGVLFRGGEEGEIRKNLIEKNKIDAIIGLPANIFFGTGIPTIIMVLKQKRDNTDVLIIDASKGFEKVGKNNKLRACDIKKIVDTVTHRLSIDKYSKVVSRDEIRNNDFNLNIPRYVDSSEKAESWDIYASMYGGIPAEEINELADYWKAFPDLKSSIFSKQDNGYFKVRAEDIKAQIKNHPEVQEFESNFKSSFDDFGDFLEKELISDFNKVNIQKEEDVISSDIFRRLENTPLINKYDAYQILDDKWQRIAIDLEILQTEGAAAIKQVDPNIVLKKKNNEEQEIQEGWAGHIIPFDLVQSTLLKDKTDALKSKNDRLSEIASSYEEIIDSLVDSLDEADKPDYLNEDNTAFVPKEVAQEAQKIKADIKKGAVFSEDSEEAKLLLADKLMSEEKEIKKQIKKETEELQLETKSCIEQLSDAEALDLLKAKWISPIVSSLEGLPDIIVNAMTSKIKTLSDKYTTTFSDVEDDIVKTEAELSSMLDELTGDDYDMEGIKKFKSLLKGN